MSASNKPKSYSLTVLTTNGTSANPSTATAGVILNDLNSNDVGTLILNRTGNSTPGYWGMLLSISNPENILLNPTQYSNLDNLVSAVLSAMQGQPAIMIVVSSCPPSHDVSVNCTKSTIDQFRALGAGRGFLQILQLSINARNYGPNAFYCLVSAPVLNKMNTGFEDFNFTNGGGTASLALQLIPVPDGNGSWRYTVQGLD